MKVCVSLRSPGMEFSLLQNLTAALSDDDTHYVVRFANSLFLQEGVTFNPEFLHLMRKYFRADVETVDFSESAAVAEQINSWVENHTESELEREGEKEQREGGQQYEHIITSTIPAYFKVTCKIVQGVISLFDHIILYKNKTYSIHFQPSVAQISVLILVLDFKSCITAGTVLRLMKTGVDLNTF